MEYILYTDGATSNNGTKNAYGGWAWALYQDNEKIDDDSGYLDQTTNNICELTAIIEGCRGILFNLAKEDTVTIYSDSAYCINCYKQKWYETWERNGWVTANKGPVKNKELWQSLIPFFKNNKYKFEKVKGHSSDERNNYVDYLAVEAKKNGHLCN